MFQERLSTLSNWCIKSSTFQTFLCYGTLIHSEFGCGTHTLKQIAKLR